MDIDFRIDESSSRGAKLNDLPEKCPICNNYIQPIYLYSHQTKKLQDSLGNIVCVFLCPIKRSCQ